MVIEPPNKESFMRRCSLDDAHPRQLNLTTKASEEANSAHSTMPPLAGWTLTTKWVRIFSGLQQIAVATALSRRCPGDVEKDDKDENK